MAVPRTPHWTIYPQWTDVVSDRGSASLEWAIAFALGMLLIVSVLQGGLWWYTRALCLHAAQQGVQAARTTGGTAADGRAVALHFLNETGAAGDPHVDVDIQGTVVTVRVAATAPQLVPIPGVDLRIEHIARAGKEHFSTPQAAARG